MKSKLLFTFRPMGITNNAFIQVIIPIEIMSLSPITGKIVTRYIVHRHPQPNIGEYKIMKKNLNGYNGTVKFTKTVLPIFRDM